MALSLERANAARTKSGPSAKKPPLHKKSTAVKPWQTTSFPQSEEALSLDILAAEPVPSVELPLTASLTRENLQNWAEMQLVEQWAELRQRSYWLSRLTWAGSWFSQLQLRPHLRIPLPSLK